MYSILDGLIKPGIEAVDKLKGSKEVKARILYTTPRFGIISFPYPIHFLMSYFSFRVIDQEWIGNFLATTGSDQGIGRYGQ